MVQHRQQHVRELFDAALEWPRAERHAWLDEACAGNVALRTELEELLVANDEAGAFLDRPPAHDTPLGAAGQRIGVYEITQEIGKGGMGSVFLAVRRDDQYRKQVAIKLVRVGFAGHDIVRRFRQERQILATLEHPNIARLIDGGTTETGYPYLVMDYVEGIPLDRYCDERRLSIVDRLRLFRTVCSAVQYAHQNLIVHRDLKPGNILVTADGIPKLLDFGIAKLLKPDVAFENPVATATGVRPMTPDYASPEQVCGAPIGTATDVYALGVVLYRLLTGHPPYRFENLSTREVTRVICEEPPPKPSGVVERSPFHPDDPAFHTIAALRGTRPDRLRRRLTGDLDTIVLTALRKDVSRRYASVEQLSEDLRRHLEGLPVSARRDTMVYRSVKFIRRHGIGVAAAVLLVLTLAGGVVMTAREARIADGQRREAELQRARAERRFNDVRRLANSFLFEFDAAIANLPGSTPARRLVVSKALEYLDSLAGESAGDAALQRDLAAAYDRIGDVQGNYLLPNLGDVKGSTTSYQKAYAIRTALLKATPTDPAIQMLLALSFRNLGDSAVGAGDHAGAFKAYRESASMSDRLLMASPDDDAVQREVAFIRQRLCNTLMLTGDVAGAIAQGQRYSAISDGLLRRHPSDLKLLQGRANNGILLGNALFITGRLDEAREMLIAADASFDRLLQSDPNDAAARRSQAMGRTRLANTLTALGDTSGAVSSYQRAVDALQALHTADPQNVRFRTDLTYALLRRVNVLLKAGRPSQARRSTLEGLTLLRASAERPSASADDLNEYAWWLVTCDPPELRDPVTALHYAKRAVAIPGAANPAFLHTLGWAQYRSGSRDQAVEALERALTALDPASAVGPAKGLRAQIEHDLADFKARGVR